MKAKELSIEEKAQRYDEAIEKLRGFYRDYDTVSCLIDVKEELANLLPELKESEDEEVRKAMIDFFKHEREEGIAVLHYGVDIERMIAWLEKQGEQKSIEWHSEDEQNLNVCLSYIPDEFLRRWLKDVIHVKYDKSADNIKQEFKVGDWVVNKFGDVWHIDSFDKKNFQVSNGDKYNYFPIKWQTDSKQNPMHLWTIEDAKDGDVLTCNEEILLFESYSVQGRISLYCWYNGQTNNFHSKEVDDALLTTRNKICPATKEQRDLLFQKMKEAGYEWNAEKKELKKIEQKQEWSEDDEQYLLVCKNALAEYQVSNKWDARVISHWLENKLEVSRNRWRPSDEHIDRLIWVINRLPNTKRTKEAKAVIEDLIEQLKKLRMKGGMK